MKDTQQAKDYFKQDIYAVETTGIKIDTAYDGYAKCSLKILPKHLNAMGYVMGGVIYTLADFAFAVASNSDNKFCVTLSSTISYLSACKANQIFAETYCEKSGRSTCFYTIKITDDKNNLIANVNTVGHISPKN